MSLNDYTARDELVVFLKRAGATTVTSKLSPESKPICEVPKDLLDRAINTLMNERPGRDLPLPGEEWEHYKGTLYRVISLARDEKDGTVLVVYSTPGGPPWVRTLESFQSQAEPGRSRFRRMAGAR